MEKPTTTYNQKQPILCIEHTEEQKINMQIENVETKLKANLSKAEELCEFFDYSSKSYNEELDRLGTDLSTDPLPCFQDWIGTTSSEINQLKSQIMFLNYVLDRQQDA